jgi:hypothetical protein
MYSRHLFYCSSAEPDGDHPAEERFLRQVLVPDIPGIKQKGVEPHRSTPFVFTVIRL